MCKFLLTNESFGKSQYLVNPMSGETMNFVKSNNLNLKIKGLHHQVAMIKELGNLSLLQRVNSFFSLNFALI